MMMMMMMYVCSYAKVRIFSVHRIFLSMYVCIYVWMDGLMYIENVLICSYVCNKVIIFLSM